MQKFRPYFTASELTEVINCLKSKSTNVALIRYLETFAIKINHGTIQPNLTLQPPKPTLEQSLGFGPSPAESLNVPVVSKETLQANAYQKYLNNPASCSPKEIELAIEYKYLQGLMSPEEEDAYFNNLVKG